MKITIAGAGAGKTTNLAERIIKCNEEERDKMIYCVSFTNSSVSTIENKLLKYYDNNVPKNIKVSTIHSFLNQEIISPYNYFIYNKHFTDIASINLPNNIKFKNSRISRLSDQDILHVDKFTEYSKFIICGKSNDKKIIKEKREIVLKILKSYFGTIFVDEAQDIDKHFLSVLETFSEMKMNVELIGDTKQDLRSRNAFNTLVEKHMGNIEYKKYSYRCPQYHLELSNLYVSTKERQISKSKKGGVINFYFEDEITDIKNFIEENNYDLKYIYQKNGSFETNREFEKQDLYAKLINLTKKMKGQNNLTGKDMLRLSRLSYSLEKIVENKILTPYEALMKVFSNKRIEYQEFNDLQETLEKIKTDDKNEKIIVDSLERIKGRGEENCLFIISPALVPYFLRDKRKKKMISHLYVGLTRSKNRLDILFTKEIRKEEKLRIKKYIEIFEKESIHTSNVV